MHQKTTLPPPKKKKKTKNKTERKEHKIDLKTMALERKNKYVRTVFLTNKIFSGFE